MSTALVILGATGDLARRKLVPALFTLHCKGRLPDDLRIIGFARSELTQATYCGSVWASMKDYADLICQEDAWSVFMQRIWFVQGDLSNREDVARLDAVLSDVERGEAEANRLYYLSIGPALYEPAIASLSAAGMNHEANGWRRIVIEKPFGTNRASAQELDGALHAAFDESQIYRIDHYLGKETVQNLLAFRFANTMFEPVWSREYVEQVQVTVAEEVDIGARAGYYDGSGALRDMVQNHLLQLLTLVAMEPPSSMEAGALRDEKVGLLRAVRRWDSASEAAQNAVAGQYEGYVSTEGVGARSVTPTYAALRLFVDTERWRGVPFYLRTGKAMAEKATEIVVQFQKSAFALFASENGDEQANTLGLCLQPDEGVHLRFQVKVPDRSSVTAPYDMEFHYQSTFPNQSIPEAYERLLEDALRGDASLFIRSDQIAESWAIVDPLLEAWSARGASPHSYRRSSWGPAAADSLVAELGHRWLHTCSGHG